MNEIHEGRIDQGQDVLKTHFPMLQQIKRILCVIEFFFCQTCLDTPSRPIHYLIYKYSLLLKESDFTRSSQPIAIVDPFLATPLHNVAINVAACKQSFPSFAARCG